jgi:hypothetical protein
MVPTGERVPPCFKIVKARRIVRVAFSVCLLGFVVLCSYGSSTASAAVFGQIGEAWGEKGEEPDQFREPTLFGVDPVDGSVYSGDVTKGAKPLKYRLQKFSPSGGFEAAAELQRWVNDEVDKKLLTLYGIAVDHERGLLYVLQGCKVAAGSFACTLAGAKLNAERILVFKTAPEGGKLVPAATPSLPLPEGAEELYSPQGIAVDPSTHDLVILAQNSEGHRVVQRFSASGTPGARFVDTAAQFNSSISLAVDPTGTTYLLTGVQNKPGAQFTRAWELPPDLSTANQVAGFAAAAEGEGWPGWLVGEASGVTGGPQTAISPDGGTLYWKETEGTETLLRAYSLANDETQVLYGGGASRCRIATPAAMVAATGDHVVVFDAGPSAKNPPYKVLTFGPGGTGCPVPAARFTIDGSEADGVVVGQGETVTFDASTSELNEAERKELIWNFGDGQKKTVNCPEEPSGGCEVQAPPTVTHVYTSGGEFTVTLEIKLITPIFGNPPPVTHTLRVPQPAELSVFRAGSGSGTVTSTPSGIACGLVCAASFEAGTTVTLTQSADAESEFAGWSGACSGTGACSVALSESKSVTARFDSEGPPPSKFDLSVLTTGSGSGTVTSSPLGISCGAGCGAEFAAGTIVALSQSADAGSQFTGWSGACSGAGACQVTMDEAKTVGASFEGGSGNAELTVSWGGAGTGRVKSDLSGINCGSVCSGEFRLGQTVTLFSVPTPGSEFERWGGDCAAAGTALTCKLTMSGNRSVEASFAAIPPASAPAASFIAPSPGGGEAPGAGKKPSAKQKALARCRRKKGRARSRCLRSVRRNGKQAKYGKRASGRGRGGTR